MTNVIEPMTRNLDLQLAESSDGHLIEDAGIDVPVILHGDVALRIRDAMNGLLPDMNSTGTLNVVKGVVHWPTESIAEAMGTELDSRDFGYANIHFSKTQLWFSVSVPPLGKFETSAIDVAEMVSTFDRVSPSQEVEEESPGCLAPIMLRKHHISRLSDMVGYDVHVSGAPSAADIAEYEKLDKVLDRYKIQADATSTFPVPVSLSESQINRALTACWSVRNDNEDAFTLPDEEVLEAVQRAFVVDPNLDRARAQDWFRDLISAGTSDIQSEADVAKSIVNSLVEWAPASTITAVMQQWLELVRDNEGGVFDAVHAFQPECDEDRSLIQQAERILSL